MKQFAFIAFFALLLLSACTPDEIIEVVEPYTYTKMYRIYAEDMTERTDIAGIYYEYEIQEPNLTDEVFDEGIIQAFLYSKKDGEDTMSPLPFSDFLVDNNGYQWEEQFTIEFQPQKIKFIQKISDKSSDLPVAEYYDILVKFLW